MKRIIALAFCLMFIFSGCAIKEMYELSSSEGRVLICNNDTFMFIVNDSPIVLDVDDLKDVDKYSTGDLVRVWHDAVLESYPGQTKAHKITLVEKGSVEDINDDVIASLTEMGWLE